jgi:prepilin-type N-terminal cleavage/methylation domain-containing protein
MNTTQSEGKPNPRRPVSPGKAAFTLVEIMIVVGIIGMMAAMGAPPFLRALRREGMNKATHELMEACKQARANAILSGQPAKLTFQPNQSRFSTAGCSGSIPGNVNILSLGINFIEYAGTDDASVTFYHTGTSDEFEITLQDDQGQLRQIYLDIVTGCAQLKDLR